MNKIRFLAVLTLSLTTSATSQFASFTEYGTGCVSSGNSTCPNSNAYAQTLSTVLRSINPQLALEVHGVTPFVNGFEIFTKSTVKRNITAWILLPDASGNPDHQNPVGTGTLAVDTTLGWYQATFPQPVFVGPVTRYFISWDQGPGSLPLTADPMPKQGLWVDYMERQLVNGQLQWITPRAWRRWAWQINCSVAVQIPRMTSASDPALGNPFFEFLLRRAPGNALVTALIGHSDSMWGTIPLPFDLTGLGAGGCTLLANPLITFATSTDVNGNANMPLPIPNQPNLKGVKLFTQWLVRDSQANNFGIIFSNGALALIGDPE